jgi:hypothetical protein
MEVVKSKVCVIGAGPCGLAAARTLSKVGIEFDGYEYHDEVGGLWDIKNPKSTMYETAHLISSKSKMHYEEFPFPKDTADYPGHRQMKTYFSDFANHFDLYKHYQFSSKVILVDRRQDGFWEVEVENLKTGQITKSIYENVIIANGIFTKPNTPTFKGQETYTGKIMHSAEYKSPNVFNGKKVLVVGAGNSGCDICVDAVSRAEYIDISVRRGYYFVPKYLFGKPADTIKSNNLLPRFLKKKSDKFILKMFTGDPVRYGFPKPDYDIFESHPIVNSQIIYHLGHGDISVKKDIDHLEGSMVHFKDGTSKEYDLILCATGYSLSYPFLDKKHLNWDELAPNLHLNIFHPKYDNMFVLGMVEATGIGWQGRYDQAELVSLFIKNKESKPKTFRKFDEQRMANKTDLTSGMKYIKLKRMAFYVHRETYLKALHDNIKALR